MKLYLAAPYAGRDILKDQVPLWQDAGHQLTCRWVNGTRPLGSSTYGVSLASSQDEVAAHALMDLDDVRRCKVLIHYTAAYLQALDPSLSDDTHNLHSGGRHVETGFALGLDKPVIILGPNENIFQRGLGLQASDVGEALALLDDFR